MYCGTCKEVITRHRIRTAHFVLVLCYADSFDYLLYLSLFCDEWKNIFCTRCTPSVCLNIDVVDQPYSRVVRSFRKMIIEVYCFSFANMTIFLLI